MKESDLIIYQKLNIVIAPALWAAEVWALGTRSSDRHPTTFPTSLLPRAPQLYPKAWTAWVSGDIPSQKGH